MIITGFYRGKAYMLPLGRLNRKHYQQARDKGYAIWTHRASMLELCEGIRWRVG